MKPTQEQVIAWAREVWGDDSGKPWSEAALLHITQLAAIAYEAGRKDEREWQGLTDKEYETMAEKYVTNYFFDTLKYAKAIEAKLKEKNS